MSEPFVKLPHAVLDHADLDAYELLVYIVLLRFRDPKTGKCFPGLQTIADTARISRKTASRTIKRLEDRRMIQVERVKAVGSPTNESNTYTVGLLPEDPMKYVATSAKGQRVPKRTLSRDSESLPTEVEAQSRDSQSLGRDSESLGVGTPSPTKKNHMKKNHEEDITSTFEESGRDIKIPNVSFDIKEENATEKQVQYIRDLSIMLAFDAGHYSVPREEHVNRWRQLTKSQADERISDYLRELGPPDAIFYPEYGSAAYEELSDAGKAFAESAGRPDSVEHFKTA